MTFIAAVIFTAAFLITSFIEVADKAAMIKGQAPSETAIETVTPVPSAYITKQSAEQEPKLNVSTHEYCEGNCCETLCPCFTGYTEMPYNESDLELMAKMVWGEARGCAPEEQRLVIWTVLQRLDSDKWGDTIEAVVTENYQFVGYRTKNPIDPDIYALCEAELANWCHGAGPPTHEIYAPTIPYYFFDGDGKHNWYREEWIK